MHERTIEKTILTVTFDKSRRQPRKNNINIFNIFSVVIESKIKSQRAVHTIFSQHAEEK